VHALWDNSALPNIPVLYLCAGQAALPSSRAALLHRLDEAHMAETTKLSVEKALNKMREADTPKSNTTRMNEEIDALDEEAKRLREQRLRLERHQRRSTKRD
jgi:hypothetical protein